MPEQDSNASLDNMTDSSGIRIAITTTGSMEEAVRIARRLVEHRLAACVNIIDHIRSIYRWEGAIEDAAEFLLVIKTDAEHAGAAEAAIRELHSYKLPEFLLFTPTGGSEAYLAWIQNCFGLIAVA